MGYIINEYESDQRKNAENWEMAIGLQKVDDLEPSDYLITIAKRNIEGELSYEKVHDLLYKHYEDGKSDKGEVRQKECDIVSARIADYLSNHSFKLSPETFRGIHRFLFRDIYDFAGKYRTYNLSKKEPVLGGKSVIYADYRNIEDTLSYDFRQEKEFSYRGCEKKELLKHITAFVSNIWQTHPFMEGNTRTTALFTECYLNSLGFEVNNEMFAEKAKYFRNALVRANYANFAKEIYSDSSFLEAFFENLIFDGRHKLQSRNLIIRVLLPEHEMK